MNLVRRSGAPSAFASILGLVLGTACAAMTACSASSGSSGGGWPGSGGGPLGGSNDDTSGASSSGSQTSSGMPDASAGKGDATASVDGKGGGGEAAPAGEGGITISVEGGAMDAPAEAAPATASFTLVDTAITGIVDGSPVAGFDPIAEGATVNLAVTGTALSVRANTVPALVGSVGFALDATYTHTENTPPYFLCSDDGTGTITSCASVLTVGKHTLTATPFSGAGLTGDAGAPIVLDFSIDDVDAGALDAGGQ
ncbi:MAG TPA: hypothetical protein VIY73_06570 [Polyangiaceae bacterium]